MTILSTTRITHFFLEIWKLSVLVAVVTHASVSFAQSNSIEVWKGGRRSEVPIQNFGRNGTNSAAKKAQAQRALIEAQTQMQMGNFNKAVQLARFANSFPVSWAPTEISPRQILMQLRTYQKQSSSDKKTRRKVKPFLWDSTNFTNRSGLSTQRTVPAKPVSNSSRSDDRFRSEQFASSRFQEKSTDDKNRDSRFPPFPNERGSKTTSIRLNKTLPRSWENTTKKTTDPWLHSETKKAKNQTERSGSPFFIDHKIEDKNNHGPLLIRSSEKVVQKKTTEKKQTSQKASEKPASENTDREVFPVIPLNDISQSSAAATSQPAPVEEDSSKLLINSTINLLSTMIGVITGALGVIFLLWLFGKRLGPLFKIEVVGDGAAFYQKQATTDSVEPLPTERSEEEFAKHFEIPSLGSSYAEKRKADEENRQKQEQEIFKLIMEQNIELRDQLAGNGNCAA